MIVMKFGGSSVGGAPRIREVAEIVRKRLKEKPIVVLSAHAGITDLLIAMAERAAYGESGSASATHPKKGKSVQGPDGLHEIRDRHHAIMDELGVDRSLIDELMTELGTLFKGISMVKELTPRTLDYVCSFGERLAVRTIAAYFNKAGIPCEPFDAFDIGMITDNNFGNAVPLPEAEALIQKQLSKVKVAPIVTGYIGKNREGEITTLGRNGSTYTAAILGAAVEAKEIQIWTDVDGIMSADPSIIADARTLDVISFEEASELAYYGAQVLHPATIIPPIRKGIPVRVLNTFKPEAPGTQIMANAPKEFRGIKSIVYKEDQYIIHITSSRMLMGFGFLATIFDVFAKYRIVVNMVATSEVTVSVTTDSPKDLDTVVTELSQSFDVRVEKEKAILCLIGEGLRDTPGIAGDVFAALKKVSVNVLMISMGASKINLACLVDNRDVRKAVEALHKTFFAPSAAAKSV